ncbi:aminotransferase class I/II-fold pyridoxal phosphate-dependent enzyme [Thermoanaerobacterium thermosaccharolyticum]|uniref:Arginine/lysine/ornithine decarboxylase n=1 Tax=Thermoanaerobacterium thermosaccharolyticum M0795 TaxID=698948 RepID=L0IIN3_THETR|nr:aminotransferase class I/II-fold pyridoxal phosphate-dependent enzyme [Thermoanaerobacterium thermosaccharolyticum]AGB17817.1 arginine/lysine/ornithine decarboxylase [Thermoanaerobacterium thermosaccharolyticum M0795]
MKLSAPLYEALLKYVEDGTMPYHMPGHKEGRIIPRKYIENLAKIDLTEVPGTDNLHDPQGPILEAEKLAAKAFGAKMSFFLVNGTTCGIYAAMSAVLNDGDAVLIQRNSHKSVYNGLILTGATPVYLNPLMDYEDGIAMGVSIDELEGLLKDNKDIKAVLITNPNYYGFCIDIKRIVDLVHKYNKILIVDEAHGAHFAFSDRLPLPASKAGADIVVESIHKTLPAFTQSSILHVNTDRVDADRLKFYLSLYQSTSPSYILMTSIDLARDFMEREGKDRLDKCVNLSIDARNKLNAIEGVKCIGDDVVGKYGINDYDTTKLPISIKGLGISGSEAERILRENFNIQMEMSDLYNILAIMTVADDEKEFDKLVKSIEGLLKYKKNQEIRLIEYYPDVPEMKMKPSEAVKKPYTLLKIDDAVDSVSLDYVIPYPPGVPLVCPGEIIKKDMVQYIKLLYNIGIKIVGIDNLNIRVFK